MLSWISRDNHSKNSDYHHDSSYNHNYDNNYGNKENNYSSNYNNDHEKTTTKLTTTTTRKFDEASDLSLAFLLKEAESFAVVEDFVDAVNNEKITESFEVKGFS